ncbi:TetR family transcriptional regulator [Streptomyces sp. NPDC001514]
MRTRRLLLQAAADEFAARGYSGARLKAVVENIGMTKGALYGHFASKEDLAAAVADEGMLAWESLRTELAAESLGPGRELRELAGQLARLMDDDTVFRAAVRLASDGYRGSSERDLPSAVSAHIIDLVRRAQEEGGLVLAFPPGTFAALVTAAVFAGAQSGREPGTGSRTRLNGLWELLGPGDSGDSGGPPSPTHHPTDP